MDFQKKFLSVFSRLIAVVVVSIGLEWLFPPAKETNETDDQWIQAFGGLVELSIFSYTAPFIVSFVQPKNYGESDNYIYAAVFLFMPQMVQKFKNWYNHLGIRVGAPWTEPEETTTPSCECKN